MKKYKILSLLLALIFSVSILVACDPQEAANTDFGADPVGGIVGTYHNVTFKPASTEQEHLCAPFVHDEAPEAEILNINWNIDNIINEEDGLLRVHQYGRKFPYQFVPLLLENSQLLPFSASTPEEARKKALAHYIIVKECVLLFETEYYYGFYVCESGGYAFPAMCFKSDVLAFDADGKYSMVTDDSGVVRRVMDFIYYSRYYNLGGCQVVQTELLQNEKSFTYTSYYIETVYGDWGVPNVVSFYKQVTEIPKDGTSFALGEEVCLKTVQYGGDDAPVIIK
ncbi:MAG: hypothetical protein J6C26_01895 [Clostridia bacterium]|nr:hypothetical protein [Clostridia bacterium]